MIQNTIKNIKIYFIFQENFSIKKYKKGKQDIILIK